MRVPEGCTHMAFHTISRVWLAMGPLSARGLEGNERWTQTASRAAWVPVASKAIGVGGSFSCGMRRGSCVIGSVYGKQTVETALYEGRTQQLLRLSHRAAFRWTRSLGRQPASRRRRSRLGSRRGRRGRRGCPLRRREWRGASRSGRGGR